MTWDAVPLSLSDEQTPTRISHERRQRALGDDLCSGNGLPHMPLRVFCKVDQQTRDGGGKHGPPHSSFFRELFRREVQQARHALRHCLLELLQSSFAGGLLFPQRAHLCVRKGVALGIGHKPVQAASNVPHLEADRRQSHGFYFHLLVIQSTAPKRDIFLC